MLIIYSIEIEDILAISYTVRQYDKQESCIMKGI